MKKKILASAMALAMALTLTACGGSSSASTAESSSEASVSAEESETTVVNPVVEYDSLDEVNELMGVNLTTPGVMGISDESYSVIDNTIAQYRFSVNGTVYTYRASNTAEGDITGVYSGDGMMSDNLDDNGCAEDETGKLCIWCVTEDNVSTVYSLYVEDNGTMEMDAFQAVAEELQMASIGVVSDEEAAPDVYAVLEGSYTDSTSQRAVATVVNNGDSLSITVEWGSSATELTRWEMTATFDSTYGLVYSDCVQKNITVSDDGTSTTEEVVAENVAGNFAIDGSCNLLWTGAADENCRECVFVKDAE